LIELSIPWISKTIIMKNPTINRVMATVVIAVKNIKKFFLKLEKVSPKKYLGLKINFRKLLSSGLL
jgi:hypothetical protein